MRTDPYGRFAAIVSVVTLVAATAAAQSAPVAKTAAERKKDADTLKLYTIDLAVPDSPAFTVLGVTPDDVTRPASPKDLVTSVLNGVDKNGHLQTGMALDIAPRMLFGGDTLTWTDYKNNTVDRLTARTQVSFATTKGATSDDPAVRLALGVHLTPWDTGDPRLDKGLQDCFASAGAVMTDPISPTLSEADIKKELTRRETAAKVVADKCRATSKKKNWAASAWSLAIAPTWASPTGAGSDLTYSGIGVWTSLAIGVGQVPTSQFILHARYRTRELVADPARQGQFVEQDTGFAGGRYRFGNPDFAGAVEAGWNRKTPLGGATTNTAHLSVGLEHRVGDNSWLDVTVGGDIGSDQLQHPLSILSSFKYGFSKTAQLADVYQPQK
jgi:hypothetical protein